MAKDKKRGFFSWLGFGRQEEQPEKAQEDEQQTPPVVEETEQHQAVTPSSRQLSPQLLALAGVLKLCEQIYALVH